MAIEPLRNILKNANTPQNTMELAIETFGRIGPPASVVTSDLIQLVGAEGQDGGIVEDALRALGKIKGDPDQIVPILIEFGLQREEFYLKYAAVDALGDMGPDVKKARRGGEALDQLEKMGEALLRRAEEIKMLIDPQQQKLWLYNGFRLILYGTTSFRYLQFLLN